MEDSRIEKRKNFLKINVPDPVNKRSEFQVSLRKKKKQNIFKAKRNLGDKYKINLPSESTCSDMNLHQVYEEILAVTSEPFWTHRVHKLLATFSKLLLTSDEEDILAILGQSQLAMTLHLILKTCCDSLSSSEIEDNMLLNTSNIVNVYVRLSELESEKLLTFMNHTPVLSKTLNNMLSKTIRLLPESSNAEQAKYFSELAINLMDTLSNLINEIGDEFESNIIEVSFFQNMQKWVESQPTMDSMEAMSWFLGVIIMQFNIPANISEYIMKIYELMLEQMLSQADIKELSQNITETLSYVINSLYVLINESETVLREFISNDILLEYVLEIIEQLVDTQCDYDKIILKGSEIIQKLSEMDYDEKYIEKGVYKVLLKVTFSTEICSTISSCLFALTNFCILSPKLNQSIIDKEALILIMEKVSKYNDYRMKYEGILFFDTLLSQNQEIDKFNKILLTDQEYMEKHTALIIDFLDYETKYPTLVDATLDYIDNLLNHESEYHDNTTVKIESEAPTRYSQKLIDQNILEKFDFIDAENHSLYLKAKKIRLRYQLDSVDPEDDDFAVAANEYIFRTDVDF